MAFSTISLDIESGVATIILRRPEVINALNFAMLGELREAVVIAPEQGARCLLLTGEGRGFCSGADLGGNELPTDAGEALDKYYNPLIHALFEAPVPVIAAVNGPAVGAGCSLALAADLVIAARSAYFSQGFVGIGLIPDAGSSWLLPRLIGRARAMEMMMLGERVSAEQALAWGMIARVADDEALMEEAQALAARLAAGPTVALRLIRQIMRDSAHLPLREALAAERAAQKQAGETADFRAGVTAFVQKVPPRFEGR